MKPIEDVREISALTYGFIASKALFAAVELDLFARIARGADTLAAIAEATGIAANRARTLLTTLKTVGLISEKDGRFANAPATATYLVAGAPGDFRDYVRVVNGGFRTRGCAISARRCAAGACSRTRVSMKASCTPKAASAGRPSAPPSMPVARPRPPAGQAQRARRGRDVLDVGGGSGAYTLAFLKQIPGSGRPSSTSPRPCRHRRAMPRRPA